MLGGGDGSDDDNAVWWGSGEEMSFLPLCSSSELSVSAYASLYSTSELADAGDTAGIPLGGASPPPLEEASLSPARGVVLLLWIPSTALFLSFSKKGSLGEDGTAVFGLLWTAGGGIAKVDMGLIGSRPFAVVGVLVSSTCVAPGGDGVRWIWAGGRCCIAANSGCCRGDVGPGECEV